MNLDQYEPVSETELQAAIVRDVAHFVAQIRDPFCTWNVSNAGDVLHQPQCVAEHLFDDVHVFGSQRVGIVQRVEFGGIAEIALNKQSSPSASRPTRRRRRTPAVPLWSESGTLRPVADTSDTSYTESCNRGVIFDSKSGTDELSFCLCL